MNEANTISPRTRERLEKVIEVLQGLTPKQKREQFNLGVWAKADRKLEARLEKASRIEARTGAEVADDCGFAACAIGWAATNPWFRRRGLTLPIHYESADPEMKREEGINRYLDGMAPSFRGEEAFDAVECFFEISPGVARHFFSPNCYERTPAGKCKASPSDVIRRIRGYLKTGDLVL